MRELSLVVASTDVEEILDRLLLLAPRGVHQRDRGTETDLRLRGAADELPAGAELAVAAGVTVAAVHTREVPDDWRERRLLDHESLVLGGALCVRPEWAPPAPVGLLDVVLPDDNAFGTGTHPTTRMCLDRMARLPARGAFADLGCGSGLLGAAAARLGWEPVVACDNDPEAVAATARTAAANGVVVDARVADLVEEPPPAADLAVANVPPDLHILLARAFDPPPRGLIASGIVAGNVEAASAAYAARGLEVRERRDEDGWVALYLTARGGRASSSTRPSAR